MNFSGAQLPVTRERTGHSCVSRSFRKASYKHKTKENISIFLITILLMEMKRHFIFFLKKGKTGQIIMLVEKTLLMSVTWLVCHVGYAKVTLEG